MTRRQADLALLLATALWRPRFVALHSARPRYPGHIPAHRAGRWWLESRGSADARVRGLLRRPDRRGRGADAAVRPTAPRVLPDRGDGRGRRARDRAVRATAHPLDAALRRCAPVYRAVREHHLLPAADARPAGNVDRAGRADLLLRAAVRGGDVLARPRGAPVIAAVEWWSVDPDGHGAGGIARC